MSISGPTPEEKIISKNPATGEVLATLDATPLEDLGAIFLRAASAQRAWAALSTRKRGQKLLDLREAVLNNLDDLVLLLSKEVGKPRFESLFHDILPTVEALTYFGRRANGILKDKKIRLRNPILLHKRSYLNHHPLGTILVIAPWNFPLFLPLTEIAMALVAGNAVVFKPSEETPLIGLKIQELLGEAGFPHDLVQTVLGDGRIGEAAIDQKPAKIFFTGSVPTGKKIAQQAARHMIPVNLELGGKDAMIILNDSDLDFASSAALWGSFSNSGQMCASTEQIFVHEKIASAFIQKIKEKTQALRQGNPTVDDVDMGVITAEKQRAVYQEQIQEARSVGAEFITGGDFSENKTFLRPTIVSSKNPESLRLFKEETFGPVVGITTFKSVAEAIERANSSSFGLTGSVLTNNLALAEEIAKKLDVGTVTINEVAYTAGIPETPWGGTKDSGTGRKHSDQGLLEFVKVRHIHMPRRFSPLFKSLWWFPYTPYQYDTFKNYLQLYRRSWFDKLFALPLFLYSLVEFLKREKRL